MGLILHSARIYILGGDGLWEGDGAGIPADLEPQIPQDPLRGFPGIGHMRGIFPVLLQGSLCQGMCLELMSLGSLVIWRCGPGISQDLPLEAGQEPLGSLGS